MIFHPVRPYYSSNPPTLIIVDRPRRNTPALSRTNVCKRSRNRGNRRVSTRVVWSVVVAAQVVARGCHDACYAAEGGGGDVCTRIYSRQSRHPAVATRWPRPPLCNRRYTVVNKNRYPPKTFQTIFAPSRCKSRVQESLLFFPTFAS